VAGPPHEEELARLDRAMRAELRAEAEAYEELAATGLLRERRLADVALELLSRGDVVAVAFAGVTFTGTLTHAAGDLACVRTALADVDVHLGAPLVLRVVERTRAGGRSRRRDPASFGARLREHEASGALVGLGTTMGAALRGRVGAVAVDHVVVDEVGGGRCFVARSALAYVARSRS
jgi:hypothetical protein